MEDRYDLVSRVGAMLAVIGGIALVLLDVVWIARAQVDCSGAASPAGILACGGDPSFASAPPTMEGWWSIWQGQSLGTVVPYGPSRLFVLAGVLAITCGVLALRAQVRRRTLGFLAAIGVAVSVVGLLVNLHQLSVFRTQWVQSCTGQGTVCSVVE